MKILTVPAVAFFLLVLALAAPGQNRTSRRGLRRPDRPPAHQSKSRGPQGIFHTEVPAHPLDVILCRPEATSVTLSVLSNTDVKVSVAYGTGKNHLASHTETMEIKKGEPREIVLANLEPDSQYYYQLRDANGKPLLGLEEACTFHTARAPGSSFVFTMTADAHLDEHTSPDVYLRTLANIQADKPDFHIDLGNLFMTDKHPTRDDAANQYLAQRYYLGLIGRSTPILLALGTHDGESAKYDDGSDNGLAVWANRTRKRYFPNPVPDGFYTGNATAKPHCGLLQDYYAWEWGDALFVVLDPFWFSARQRGGRDGWQWSLGQSQYAWLKKTLEQSRIRFKFVFIHNLLCGDQAARGGVEVAAFNEWGGKNPDGTDGFKQHRPGWDAPIHQLLVHNHVAAVFKAHDNFYARQELDGILYLMVPQPSFAGSDRIRDLEAYGYKRGTFLCNSGHVRVTVSPDRVKVDYIRSGSPKSKADSGTHVKTICRCACSMTRAMIPGGCVSVPGRVVLVRPVRLQERLRAFPRKGPHEHRVAVDQAHHEKRHLRQPTAEPHQGVTDVHLRLARPAPRPAAAPAA